MAGIALDLTDAVISQPTGTPPYMLTRRALNLELNVILLGQLQVFKRFLHIGLFSLL